MSLWHLFMPQRERRGPADPAKGEVTCHACGRVRHISYLSHAAALRLRGKFLFGNCPTCGGRSWTIGWLKGAGGE